MARKQKQSGFTVVEILLVLILLAVVGFAGYYVWHSQKTTNTALTATSQTSKSKTSANTGASSPAKPSSQKYLTISEWGIRMPYGTDYTFNYSFAGRDQKYAQFSTDQLAKIDPSCSADNAAIGVIGRFKANDTVYDDGTTAAQAVAGGAASAHIGNYYYIYLHPQAMCSQTTGVDVSSIQTAAQNELKALLPLAEATK